MIDLTKKEIKLLEKLEYKKVIVYRQANDFYIVYKKNIETLDSNICLILINKKALLEFKNNDNEWSYIIDKRLFAPRYIINND